MRKEDYGTLASAFYNKPCLTLRVLDASVHSLRSSLPGPVPTTQLSFLRAICHYDRSLIRSHHYHRAPAELARALLRPGLCAVQGVRHCLGECRPPSTARPIAFRIATLNARCNVLQSDDEPTDSNVAKLPVCPRTLIHYITRAFEGQPPWINAIIDGDTKEFGQRPLSTSSNKMNKLHLYAQRVIINRENKCIDIYIYTKK